MEVGTVDALGDAQIPAEELLEPVVVAGVGDDARGAGERAVTGGAAGLARGEVEADLGVPAIEQAPDSCATRSSRGAW